ncbi:MAG TPA: CoA transferase [Acidimicrobiales bacterium]|nr:CoA transferase [Acidimicrobiales bacterium]
MQRIRSATAGGDAAAGTHWEEACAWARSGVVPLCGEPAGPPLLPPLGAAGRIAGVAGEISRLTAMSGRPVGIRWEAALAGRATILGLARQGRVSANGSCRLISAGDGDVALNLPRPDDLSLIPALTADPDAEDAPWGAAAAMATGVRATDFVERARLLGLAASVAGERSRQECQPGEAPGGDLDRAYAATPRGDRAAAGSRPPDTVVDLSSLWAGPVTARVLAEAGAKVIKVEDASRQDAARLRPEFYSWIHPATETTVRLDLTSPSGRQRLRELLGTAQVVIESSRPRALEQMGLGPDQIQPPEGQVWLAITAHGRSGPAREWTGFGDDAAVAGGLLCRAADGTRTFCGDAIADPVAGLVGAMAVLRCLGEGGGRLVDVSLSGAAAWAAGDGGPDPRDLGLTMDRSGSGWALRCDGLSEAIAEAPPTLDWIGQGVVEKEK